MKTNKLNLLVTLTLMLLFTASSFAQFTLKGEFRNRTEYNASEAGRNALVNENADSYLSSWQRSRIVAHYKESKLETKFSIQDVRAFATNYYIDPASGKTIAWKSNNGSALAVHEAWAKYYITDNIGLKIGRQELKFGDGRLMWNKDWDNYGGAHDAFSFEGTSDKLDWTVGIALNSVEDRVGTGGYSAYKNLGLIHVSAKITDDITLNFTNLYEGNEQDGTDYVANPTADADYQSIYKNSIGINPVAKFGPLTVDASFYYQLGKQSLTVDYAAMMYTANVKYKLNDMITLGAGYDSYSGEAHDADQTDNKVKAFAAPYQGAHKFFGNTDFQLKMFGKGHGANDIYLKIDAKVSKKTSLMLGFHNISFAQEAIVNTKTFKAVGNNIDLQVKQGLGKGMAVLAGYSVMLPSDEYTEMTLGVDVNAKFHQFAWVMFKFTPTFLKTEAKKEIKKEVPVQ